MYWPHSFAGMVPPATPGIGARDVAWPSQTDVARCGVKPTNQASVKLSVVPVLPAAGQPICVAFGKPVSALTFCSRIFVASAVTPSENARCLRGRARVSTWWGGTVPWGLGVGGGPQPRAAIVEYAFAISSGETPRVRPPRPSAGYACRRVLMPMSYAVWRTALGPTSASSWAYTELSDFSVALTRLMRPAYVLPYVWTE